MALELRNPNGTYTLGVGMLRLSGLGALGAWLYWASHAWLLAALWRIIRGPRPLAECVILAFVAVGVIAVRVLLYSMPLSQMIIRPWIR